MDTYYAGSPESGGYAGPHIVIFPPTGPQGGWSAHGKWNPERGDHVSSRNPGDLIPFDSWAEADLYAREGYMALRREGTTPEIWDSLADPTGAPAGFVVALEPGDWGGPAYDGPIESLNYWEDMERALERAE